MPIHSKILIHWTDPNKIKKLNSQPNLRDNDVFEAYKEHLKNILKYGLKFNKINEEYWFNGKPKRMPVEELCFTELKLSETSIELDKKEKIISNIKYGRMGIGIHRKFVIKNHGNPVFYVETNDKSNLASNIDYIIQFAEKNNKDICNRIKKILSYIKPMGENPNDHYFKNYDDLEWRIALDEDKKNLPPNVEKGKDGSYYLKFKFNLQKIKNEFEKCIECIIFPNEEILYKSIKFLKDDAFFNNFEHNNIPILTTVNRIRHL